MSEDLDPFAGEIVVVGELPGRPTTPPKRSPRSSRLSARCDIAFRLVDDPSGEWVGFTGLVPSQVSIERNRPAECDTCDVTLVGDALPFDLGVIAPKSALVSVWLFEHQNPKACANGQPGQFFGVVDDITRDRYSLRVTLKCRDLTAVALGAKLSEEQVKAFPVEDGASVEAVVLSLVKAIPGTMDWRVDSRSAAASRPGVYAPTIKTGSARRGTKAPPPRSQLGGGTAHLADIVPAHELTVWSAVANVCARAGVVPEVQIDGSGNPVVVLVDGSDLQNTDVLRPFAVRNGRKHRVLVDGDGVGELAESLALSGGQKRPDFLQVDSIDPRTGEGLSARWPPGKSAAQRKREGEDTSDEGMFQFVRAVSSRGALLRMAKAGFEALCHNTYRVKVTVNEPWSAGGSPEDPDLLALGYGAAIEIVLPAFEAIAKQRGLETPEKIMAQRGVPADVARRILAASARIRALSLLFQVEDVSHQWSGGSAPSYSCQITMRRFMGTLDLPIVAAASADGVVDRRELLDTAERPRRGLVSP